MQGPPTWLLAHPTPGQVRAVEPLADPAFHQAMARRASAVAAGTRYAGRSCWASASPGSRGPGGRTVARLLG